jgi:hypothetical protein
MKQSDGAKSNLGVWKHVEQLPGDHANRGARNVVVIFEIGSDVLIAL